MDFLAFILLSFSFLITSALPSSSPATESSTSGTHQSSPPFDRFPAAFAPILSVLKEVTIFAIGFLVVVFSMYKKKMAKIAKRFSSARLPTACGSFVIHCYKALSDGLEHVAIVKGDIGNGQNVLVRVHSECLTGDVFRSARCDCGNQLELAMKRIEEAGRGVVVYLRGQEGRGIGLGQKLRAYNLQDDGRDTVQANQDLGFPVDSRDYSIGAQILKDLGVKTMKLMTNNPTKCIKLKGYGLEVTERVPVVTPITNDNMRYLQTQKVKMGHIYGSGTDDAIY